MRYKFELIRTHIIFSPRIPRMCFGFLSPEMNGAVRTCVGLRQRLAGTLKALIIASIAV